MQGSLFILDIILLSMGITLAGMVWRWLGSLFVAMFFVMAPTVCFYALTYAFPDLRFLVVAMGSLGPF